MARFQEKFEVYQSDNLNVAHEFDAERVVDVIAKLQKLVEKHGKDAILSVDIDSDYGCNSGYTTVSISVRSTRPETKEEYNARKEQFRAVEKFKRDEYKKRKLAREEQDRKEFERLSKKFAKSK